MANKCLTCPKLMSRADGAGGGKYKCQDYPGVVIGEWGHWVDDGEPTAICELTTHSRENTTDKTQERE